MYNCIVILGSILLNFVSQFLAGIYVGQGFYGGKQPSVEFHMNSWKKLREIKSGQSSH